MGTASQLGHRCALRAKLEVPVLVDAFHSYQTGRCRDVSEAGLGIELPSRLRVGDTVDVYFELPTGIAVEGRAQVVRSDGQNHGLVFRELPEAELRALRFFCQGWRLALPDRFGLYLRRGPGMGAPAP